MAGFVRAMDGVQILTATKKSKTNNLSRRGSLKLSSILSKVGRLILMLSKVKSLTGAIYFHALSFAMNEAKTNGVCLARVYIWLAVSAYYRQEVMTALAIVNLYGKQTYAFEKLDQRKEDW